MVHGGSLPLQVSVRCSLRARVGGNSLLLLHVIRVDGQVRDGLLRIVHLPHTLYLQIFLVSGAVALRLNRELAATNA